MSDRFYSSFLQQIGSNLQAIALQNPFDYVFAREDSVKEQEVERGCICLGTLPDGVYVIQRVWS